MQTGPIRQVLEGAKAGSEDDWALVWTVEELESERVEVEKGWFSDVEREVFRLDPLTGRGFGGDAGGAQPDPAAAAVPGAGGEGSGRVPVGAEIRGGQGRAGGGLCVRTGMSAPRDEMELTEEAIRRAVCGGGGDAGGVRPCAAAGEGGGDRSAAEADRSPGVGARPRFRSTTPGLVTQPSAKAEGVRLVDRVMAVGEDDPIVAPVEASVLQALAAGAGDRAGAGRADFGSDGTDRS